MNSRKRHFIRRYPFMLIGVVMCCGVVFISLFTLSYDEKPFQSLMDDAITEYVVDTPTCKIPSWNPWDPSLRSLYQPVSGPYMCKGQPSFLRVKANAVVTLDNTFLELYYEISPQNVSCTYQPIYRDDAEKDESVDSRFLLGKPRGLPFNVPLMQDYIKTSCTFCRGPEQKTETFVEYLALTPLKIDVEKRSTTASAQNRVKKKLNVIFVGIDSISRLNYLRHFPKTRQYLSEHLFPIDLKGYTKVGDNTFPNLVPLLTGHFYQHYWKESENKTMFFDDVDFLWKEFAKRGYRTLLAEDAPDIATFNYMRKGFKNPPTDYYFRPFALAVENSEARSKSKNHCLGNKMEMEVVYDYLRSFVDTMGTSRRFFAFVFLARLTHDVFNNAGYADEPTYQLLHYLHESKILRNSLLVLFSDHGIRFGDIRKTYIGQFEERMPFVNLIFPQWFLKKYKILHRNLKLNQNRLTSPFDIHSTLMDLLNLDNDTSDEAVLTSPGISLFREVSPHRTCSHASISPHWCTCHVQKTVPVTDSAVVAAAQTVIQTINNWTRNVSRRCVHLKVRKVIDARMSKVHSRSFVFQHSKPTNTSENYDLHTDQNNSEVDYLIVVSATPSGGLFEATVRCDTRTLKCSVIDDISRINRYGDQSACVDNSVLRKFCFCS